MHIVLSYIINTSSAVQLPAADSNVPYCTKRDRDSELYFSDVILLTGIYVDMAGVIV